MRTFFKKSSLALLLAVLVLLTAVMVGGMVTASAEEAAEPEYEASIYHPVSGLLKSGRLDALLSEYGWLSASYSYSIVLHKDAEIAIKELCIKGIGTIEGNGNTIYVDNSVNGASKNAVFEITHEGKTVLKNINFVGQDREDYDPANPVVGNSMLYIEGDELVLENCTFTNCKGGALVTSGTKLTLDNVVSVNSGRRWTVINSEGKEEEKFVNAFEVQNNTQTYLKGDTRIFHTSTEDRGNRINGYNTGASLGIAGTFTGEVVFIQWGYAVNRPTFYMCDRAIEGASGYKPGYADRSEYCTVAEGALLLGKIYDNNQGGWLVYNNQGTLCWTKAGQALPAVSNAKIELSQEDPSKIVATGWFYNKDGKNCFTTSAVAGGYAFYALEDAVVEGGIDAYIVRDGALAVYGSLAHVLSQVQNGDTVEVYQDVVLPAGATKMKAGTYTVDFNGFNVTRADKTAHLYASGAAVNITLKNGHFDGEIGGAVPKDARALIELDAVVRFAIENCTFTNLITTAGEEGQADTNRRRGSVVHLVYESNLYLKDVTITNSEGTYGSVYCFNTDVRLPHVYIEGNTNISGGKNRIDLGFMGPSALNVSGDFTGLVDVNTRITKVVNDQVRGKVTTVDPLPVATVAEGAKITGVIRDTANSAWFAYNNQGILCWTQTGADLPVDVKQDENDPSKLAVLTWYYDNAGVKTATTTAVAGVRDYTWEYVALSIEAYIVRGGATVAYGTFSEMLAAAAAGDTIELVADVANVHNLLISKAITIDGNGHSLTWVTTTKPEESAGTAVGSGSNSYFIKNSAALVLKDLVLDGGATEYGVWPTGEGAKRNYDNSTMFAHTSSSLTFDGCTIKGLRVKFTLTENANYGQCGAMFAYPVSSIVFKDTTFVDNMWMGGPGGIFRQANNSGIVTYEGRVIFKENYKVSGDGTTATVAGVNAVGNSYRTKLGQLSEGSELWLDPGTSVFQVTVDEVGQPYNNSGKVYITSSATVNVDENGKFVSAGYANNNVAYVCGGQITDPAFTGHQVNLISLDKVDISDTVNAQGGITSDKFTLNYTATITADYFATDVVVKINGREVLRKAFGEFENAVSKTITIADIGVGMAEFTDEIVIELQNGKTGEVLDSYTTTAKTYANALLALDSYGDYTAEKLLSMKKAVASLLQYGAKVQTFFKHNTANLAMTADEEAAWLTAGYIEEVGNGLKGGTSVQATESGSVAGVATYGATLTMENQMSLRLYFTAASLEGLTFTVDGVEVTPVEANGMYYIEAAHIGTASLAKAVNFVIASETESITYTASPMSYVFAVFALENDAVTAELKDACEALYYYFVAAGEHFNFSTDIGFTTALSVSVDPVNNFSIPYGIKA